MKFGVSTACLYPLHTEDALAQLAALGIKAAEVFANSTSEANEPIISQMDEIRQKNGMTITSLHPFSSPMESVFLFGNYDRRVEEMLELYGGFFAGMKKLGADIFVLHGAILSSGCEPKLYLERFRLLAEAGRQAGVTVAQENVSYCMSGNLEFLLYMKKELGSLAKFVLDLKQARRSGSSALDYADALGESIVHCHCSDADENGDCLPIGEGNFDFPLLAKKLAAVGYDGAYIVELYRRNYGGFTELKTSAERLEELVRGAIE